MIEWTKHFIDISDGLVTDLLHDIVIVAQSKLMTQFDNVTIHSLTHINHNVFLCPRLVFHDHLSLWQVNVEVVEAFLENEHVFI